MTSLEPSNMCVESYAEITKQNIEVQENIFLPLIDTEKIDLKITDVDKNIELKLLTLIQKKLHGKCNKNGLVRNNSIKLLNYSSGVVDHCKVVFHVNYECEVCNPVEGMVVKCIIKNITKAGIRAELEEYDNNKSPIVIFIAREHNNSKDAFLDLKENDKITVKIVGVKYEINDEEICTIGEILF
jgi:DNA-directed RNA polymerase subunit E'/Rpb7